RKGDPEERRHLLEQASILKDKKSVLVLVGEGLKSSAYGVCCGEPPGGTVGQNGYENLEFVGDTIGYWKWITTEKIWEVMLGVIATDMIVAGGRSLYRPLEEAERQRGLGHRGVGEGETTEGQGPSVFGTEGRAEQSEVMKEPLAAGENEFKDAAVDTVPSGPMARVAAIKSEVKTEPNVKVEYDG
ncbi:hypothetical protein JG687_00018602, partial [Phytophthora cactorum]